PEHRRDRPVTALLRGTRRPARGSGCRATVAAVARGFAPAGRTAPTITTTPAGGDGRGTPGAGARDGCGLAGRRRRARRRGGSGGRRRSRAGRDGDRAGGGHAGRAEGDRVLRVGV